MMGAGKSTVGRKLAELLDVPFADTDTLLSYRLGRPIPKLFEFYGEEAFRGHETAILKSLEREPGVLATGGGTVKREENWDQFRRLGRTIFLDVSPEVLKARLSVSRKRRPLLETENWEATFDELYENRRELYERADIIFPIVSEALEDVAERLFEELIA